jgi:hypothetical protein
MNTKCTEEKPYRNLRSNRRNDLGMNLKRLYAEMIVEPVPEPMMELLRKLER